MLSAVASADNSSGYVFGVHSNFDPFPDRDAVEADANGTGDCLLPSPLRKYARFWLECDYRFRQAKLREFLVKDRHLPVSLAGF